MPSRRPSAATDWRGSLHLVMVDRDSVGELPMRLRCTVALFAFLPAVAFATEPGAPPGLTDIPVAEWTELAGGRTLTYTIGGEFWALERYHPGGSRVTLQFYDGSCLNGYWDYADPLYCFHWEGEGTSCFRHARLGDEILILETESGVETGALQNMTGVSDAPLACGPAGTS